MEREKFLRTSGEASEENEFENEEESTLDETSLLESASDDDLEAVTERGELPAIKESEIKKMFRAIASVSHPDKLGKDVPSAQKVKLDKIFKKAKNAYTNGNWYILYSISLDLGLDAPEPTKEHSEWLEEDIKFTQNKVSHIESLLVWVWYSGDEDSRKFALRNYFQQVYDHTLTDLP